MAPEISQRCKAVDDSWKSTEADLIRKLQESTTNRNLLPSLGSYSISKVEKGSIVILLEAPFQPEQEQLANALICGHVSEFLTNLLNEIDDATIFKQGQDLGIEVYIQTGPSRPQRLQSGSVLN